MPSPIIIGKITKCFNTAIWTFFSTTSETKITYTCWAIQKSFFICYLTATKPNLFHYQGDGCQCMLIIALFYFRPANYWETCNYEFIKIWDRLHTDAHKEKLTDTYTNRWIEKSGNLTIQHYMLPMLLSQIHSTYITH